MNMDDFINIILKKYIELFGDNPSYKKINVGFTNKIYEVNNKYIIKVCINKLNEEKFLKEIDFYNLNSKNSLIPKMYYFDIKKEIVPYIYVILEKVDGVSLYNVWHMFKEEERENVIKQLCEAMQQIHKNGNKNYDWNKYIKDKYIDSFNKIEKYNIFNDVEKDLLKRAFLYFDELLVDNEIVLIHNDLHFDNIIYNEGKIKLIDFERSMYASKDFELDIIYRMIRKPWKFASEETEKFTDLKDYENIMKYIEKYYFDLVNKAALYKRLAIYDIIYFMRQLSEYPTLQELKDDVILAAKKIIDN